MNVYEVKFKTGHDQFEIICIQATTPACAIWIAKKYSTGTLIDVGLG